MGGVIVVTIAFINIIVGSAVVYDIFTGKVPNRLMLMAYLLAPLFLSISYGIGTVPMHMLIAFAIGVMLFIFYLIRAIGAGDVKLMSFVCLFLSFRNAFRFIYIVLIAGAFLGLLKMVVAYVGQRNAVSEGKMSNKIKFTIPIAIGYVLVMTTIV